MSRTIRAILIGLFCCGAAANAAGQTRNIDSPEVLKQLMALPAPTPRNAATPAVTNIRPLDFFAREKSPPDDAPIEDLVDYWGRWTNGEHEPSDAVKQRLLEACVANPEILATMLYNLPESDSAAAKVKNLYDKALANEQFDQSWRERVKRWLLFNTTSFLDELTAMAHKAKDNVKDGDVDREDAVVALANLSWTNAEPLLRGLIASGQPRATALAVSLYFQHAVDEKDLANEERYRRELQSIAANRMLPGYARYTAVESLSLNEWPGRDEWYLTLFQDETLRAPDDGEYNTSPLTILFKSDPAKWIPLVTKLVESRDINVRSAAAACLISVEDGELAKKALVPLLPWLTDPAWATEASNERVSFVQRLGTVKIPESVPGLISVLQNEDPELNAARFHAAEALAQYEDPRAVPFLRKLLAKEKEEGARFRIIKGLIGSKGLSDQDQLGALEEYAAKVAEPNGWSEVIRYRTPAEEPLSPTLMIGKYLSQNRETPDESLVAAVLARAEELRTEKPAVAKALLEITHVWGGRQVEFDIVRRIGNGSADSKTILEAIQRRNRLQEALLGELQGLASVAGAAQAVGAVLLEDQTLAQEILGAEDETAQIALLASARLTQMALPVEQIGPFLRHKNPLLTQAAETYLLAEDSPEARNLLWQHHPNEAFITGWRENLYYTGYGGGNIFAELVKHEESLRDEILKDNGPTEIIASLTNVAGHGTILRIYPDKAICTESNDSSRYRERNVSKAEVAAFKDFLTTGGFFERGPTFEWCHHGCPVSELVTITKEKGRRFFRHSGYTSFQELDDRFSQLASGDGSRVHYKLEDEIKGLEVLYAGELIVNDVAQQGNELRVFFERPETKEEIAEIAATYNANEDDDEEVEAQLARRRVELTKARYSWRVFAGDKPGAITTPPDFYSVFDQLKFMTGGEADTDWESGYGFETQVLAADSIIIARSDGLWRQFAGAKPVRLVTDEASYEHPIVTRDGKWVIATKSEEEKPEYIVRVNLQTGREFRVNMPAADDLTPVAFLPTIGNVVVRRSKSQYAVAGTVSKGPERPEYYLLDPATGATRLISGGNFVPLLQTGSRFLQAADKPDEFWAAIADEKKNYTEIGRYSVKDFTFKPVLTVPQLAFDSMAMWVDAAQRKVYVVYKGQLLRLPLQSAAK